MLVRKMLAVGAAVAALVVTAAGPAGAIESMNHPSDGCWWGEVLATYSIDNPAKAGTQDIGTARLVRSHMCSEDGEPEWSGVWTEAKLDNGGTIRVGIQVTKKTSPYTAYSLSRYGSGTSYTKSPVLESTGYYVAPWVQVGGKGAALYG